MGTGFGGRLFGPGVAAIAMVVTNLSACSLLLSTDDLSTPNAGDASINGGDGNPATACDADTRADLDNCGSCGNRCLTRANGFPECTLGACTTKCNATFGDCDGNAANGCEASLNADIHNCGACGRDCGGGTCVDGSCSAVKLTTSGLELYSVGSDGVSVFFTTVKDGSAYRCAVAGCPGGATRIGVGDERSYYLGLDATHVYWNNNSTVANTKPGQVLRCAKTGCTNSEIITKDPMPSAANPTDVQVDADNVYWSSNEGSIWRAPKVGGGGGIQPIAVTNLGHSVEFVVRDKQLYISAGNAVHVCPTTGCASPPPRLVSADQNGVGGIATDGTSVFWIRADAVLSHDVGANGSVPPKSIAVASSAGRIVVAENDLYWTEQDTGIVSAMPKTGGAIRRLATNQLGLAGLAVDAKFVYWVSINEGAIYKIAR